MKFRPLSILVAVLIVVSLVFASTFMKKPETPVPKKEAKKNSKVRKVKVQIIKNKTINANIHLTGKLVATDKIEVFSEVSGTLLPTNQRFKEGNRFSKGQTLIKIEKQENYYSLLSQKSQLQNLITQFMPEMKLDFPNNYPNWEQYLNSFEISQKLKILPKPLTHKERNFLVSKGIYTQYYNIKSQEERLSKYQISAPFSGVVSESNINPGALVRIGQKLGEFMNVYDYELEATLSLKDLKLINIGQKVSLGSEDLKETWIGTIKRISDRIDENTQSVSIFVAVKGKGLKEGMFLQGNIVANNLENVVAIPRNILLEDNKVFVVTKNNKLSKENAQVLRYTESKVIVKGLHDNTKVLLDDPNNVYEGMKVKVE